MGGSFSFSTVVRSVPRRPTALSLPLPSLPHPTYRSLRSFIRSFKSPASSYSVHSNLRSFTRPHHSIQFDSQPLATAIITSDHIIEMQPAMQRKRKLSVSGPATKDTLVKKFKEQIDAEKRKKIRLEWYLKQLLLEKEMLVKENEIEFAQA